MWADVWFKPSPCVGLVFEGQVPWSQESAGIWKGAIDLLVRMALPIMSSMSLPQAVWERRGLFRISGTRTFSWCS